MNPRKDIAVIRSTTLVLVLSFTVGATACKRNSEANMSPGGAMSAPAMQPGAQPPAMGTMMPTPTAELNLSGPWSSLFGGGTGGGASPITLNIVQSGTVVTGNYAGVPGAPLRVASGTITGVLRGAVVQGTWSDSDGYNGPFTWNIAGDGRNFAGTWSSRTLSGAWTGTR